MLSVVLGPPLEFLEPISLVCFHKINSKFSLSTFRRSAGAALQCGGVLFATETFCLLERAQAVAEITQMQERKRIGSGIWVGESLQEHALNCTALASMSGSETFIYEA